MSAVLAWTAPPTVVRPKGGPGRPPGRRARFVDMLKERPERWAQYLPGFQHSASAASVMTHDYPGVEAQYRKRPDGGYDIYARWVG